MNHTEASDAILAAFAAYWSANAPAQNGGVEPEVRWPGVDEGELPDGSVAWCRVTLRHFPAGQRTLGPIGARRFARNGVVTVQVFAPLLAGRGDTQAQALAIIARDAFEGKTAGAGEGVWFRATQVREVGPDRAWFQMNATADFEYDEIK